MSCSSHEVASVTIGFEQTVSINDSQMCRDEELELVMLLFLSVVYMPQQLLSGDACFTMPVWARGMWRRGQQAAALASAVFVAITKCL